MRTAQDFNPVDVHQIQRGLTRAGSDDAVDYGRHSRLDAGRCGDRANATNKQRRILVRRAGAEIDRRRLRGDRAKGIEIALLELLTTEHRDCNRHRLQRLAALGGGDGDGLELVGGLSFNRRCGRLLGMNNTRDERGDH